MTTKEWLEELSKDIRTGHAVQNDDAVRLLELLRRTQADVQGHWDAWQQEMGKVRRAEAALATMIEQKEYFRQCWEVAEAALDAVPVAALRRLAEMHRAHQWSSTEGPALWATVEAWLEAQP